MNDDLINEPSPADIEQDIERTRQRMTTNLDELGDRLSPENLKRQAKDAISEKAQDVVTNVGDQARQTGVVALDLRSGEKVFSLNERRALQPASVEKLALAYAALHELGPDFRIETDVLGDGELQGTTWRGNLVLKGFGDPTLSRDDLRTLARGVRAYSSKLPTMPFTKATIRPSGDSVRPLSPPPVPPSRSSSLPVAASHTRTPPLRLAE